MQPTQDVREHIVAGCTCQHKMKFTPGLIHPDPAAVEQIAELLLSAQAPLIVGGRFGIDRKVTEPLVRLVELTGAAYLDDRGIVCFPTEHPQNLNGDKAIKGDSDLIVAFDVQDLTLATSGHNAGRSTITAGGKGATNAQVVDVSLSDYFGNSWTRFGGPTPPLDWQITADPLLSLKKLVEAVKHRSAAGQADQTAIEQRRERLAERHAAVQRAHQDRLKKHRADTPISIDRLTYEVYRAVRSEYWRLVVRNHRSWRDGHWAFSGAGDYLGGDGGGGVDHGPGAAVGAALGLKGQNALPVAIIGDGDFMMAPGAIWSAAHNRIPLLMVIMNNRSWGNDELHQREIAAHRHRDIANAHIGQRTSDPDADLAAVARGFGAWAEPPVYDPERLAGVLDRAVDNVKHGGLSVVEVITSVD